MNENVFNDLDSYNGSSSNFLGNSEEVSDSSSEIENTSIESGSEEEEEESSEIDSQTESGDREEASGDTETSIVYDSDTLTHIDNTLNSFLGLFVATLVVVGIGLILKYIWGLLNK